MAEVSPAVRRAGRVVEGEAGAVISLPGALAGWTSAGVGISRSEWIQCRGRKSKHLRVGPAGSGWEWGGAGAWVPLGLLDQTSPHS